ncbi:hypothetical protein SBA2_150023 [Acidobacteriia bacterium SbA2]|nr:hypothetical protein SBA2_150023 [Acidobacteriia bacterium SbA2]
MECGCEAAAVKFRQNGGSWRYRTPRRAAQESTGWSAGATKCGIEPTDVQEERFLCEYLLLF